jgi:hypothetical protein
MDVSRMRRTDLYEAVLRRLLSGQWKDPPRDLSKDAVDAKLELLEPVAFKLFAAGKEQFFGRELRHALRAAYADLYPKDRLSDRELTERIQEWSKEDGVLIEAGAGDAPYLFLHLTFQEYLTACHLARVLNAGGWDRATIAVEGVGDAVPVRTLLDHRAWLPAWQEVIILLGGTLEDPAPLLEMLADDSKDDIFRHRLALAALCLPEIKELLEDAEQSAARG